MSLRCLQGHAEPASSLLTNSQTGPSSSPEVIGRWPHEGRSWRGGEGGRDCRAVSYIKSAVFTLEIGWVRRRLEWSGTGLFSRCATAVPMGAGKSKDSAYRTVRVDNDGGLMEIQHNARGRIERRRVLRIRHQTILAATGANGGSSQGLHVQRYDDRGRLLPTKLPPGGDRGTRCSRTRNQNSVGTSLTHHG